MATDFTALQDALAGIVGDREKKVAAFYRLINTPALEDNFTPAMNIRGGIITPVFKVEAGIQPYSGTYSGGGDETWDVKEFKVFENKIEQTLEPKKYTKYWNTIGWVDTQGVPKQGYNELASRIIGSLIEVNSEKIRKEIIWTGKRNDSGTAAVDTLNGFQFLIDAAITSGDLDASCVAATGAVGQSNVLDSIEMVLECVEDDYLQLPDFQVLVSKTILKYAIKAYEDAHMGNSPMLIYDSNNRVVGMYLGGAYSGIPVKMERSMKNSGKIIATYKGNLQFGSSENDFQNYTFDVQKHDWNLHLMASVDLGCGVYEFGNGAFAVNDQN